MTPALLSLALTLGAAPAAQPVPQPTTAAPVSAPTVSPTPAVPTPSPSAAPGPEFRYIYTPSPGLATPAPDAPRIMEIDFTDQTVHQNSDVALRVVTTSAVATVVVSALGRDAAIPQAAAGIWNWQGHVPSVPFFLLNRTYDVQVRAMASDGRSDAVTLPIRLAR